MKKFILIALLAVTSSLVIAPNASAAIANCVTFGSPSVSNNDTSIVVQVSINVTCTATDLGTNGGSPSYRIVEENSDTSNCTGPSTLAPGLSSSIRCRINMGTTNGSSRTGATSSTILITFRFDGSTKLIPFSHDRILGSNAVCKIAPLTPILDISYPSPVTGPRFDFRDNPNSDIAQNLIWTYATYDANSKTWDAWNPLTIEKLDNKGHGSFIFISNLMPNKSKIAFYVYAQSTCGSSLKAKESIDGSGIPLAGLVQNTATLKIKDVGILDTVLISDLIEVTSGNTFNVTSRTPTICQISNGKLLPISLGNCLLSINAQANFNVTALNDFALLVNIGRSDQTLTNFSFKSAVIGETISMPGKSDQGLEIIPDITSKSICKLEKGSVIAIAAGKCTGSLLNAGNDKYNFYKSAFSVDINKQSQTIQVANLAAGLAIKNKVAVLKVTATSKLPVSANNLTPKVCKYSAGKLTVYANGLCNFELVQPGNEIFNAAPKLKIKLTIANQKAGTK